MKTLLKMTNPQYRQLYDFIHTKKIASGFGLLAQPLLGQREIDVVVLTFEQCRKLNPIFKKIGLTKGIMNETAIS